MSGINLAKPETGFKIQAQMELGFHRVIKGDPIELFLALLSRVISPVCRRREQTLCNPWNAARRHGWRESVSAELNEPASTRPDLATHGAFIHRCGAV